MIRRPSLKRRPGSRPRFGTRSAPLADARPGSRARSWTRAAAVLLALGLPGAASAQLLAEVMVTTAILATFDANVRFPSGSLSAVGADADRLIARVPGSADWAGWEVYTARGIATNLQDAFVHQIATAFAVAGYFESARSETDVTFAGQAERHTRIVFEGDTGSRLLYLIRAGQELVWLTAAQR